MVVNIHGSCHCGAVTLKIPNPPQWVVECGCSICSKLGTLWVYYPDNAVNVTGQTALYTCNNKVIALHRCITCGCTTHWKTLGKNFGRMAINARLLHHLDWASTQVRVTEGSTSAVFGDFWPPRV